MNNIFYVKDYLKDGISDSEAIKRCFAEADAKERRTVIFDGKDWNVDESVVLKSDTHVIIDGCTVKQNDEVFDNFFRGANIEVDPENPYGYAIGVTEIKNIKIEGRRGAKLIGTDKPRVGYHPGKDEYQQMTGDFWGWRTMMIYFAFGENIEVSGLELSKTMCWAVDFEWCSKVHVHDLAIYSYVKNGDGIDFRSGCHDCLVENITGYTSDDTVACTALSTNKRGEFPNKKSVYPMAATAGLVSGCSTDIHDVTVRGVNTGGLCHGMICLAANGNHVYNINISDFNEAPEGGRAATVSIYTGYGDGYTAGDIHHINIDGIHATQADYALEMRADIRDIFVNNISQENKHGYQLSVFPKSKKRERTPIPIGMSIAGGIHAEQLTEETFRQYKNGGIKHIEISLPAREVELLDFRDVVKSAYNEGVKIDSLHLPFLPFEEIDISKPALAEYTVGVLASLIRRAAYAGIKRFVIHPSGEPIGDGERSERMECAKASLKALADVAKECGSVIAVENLPRTCLGKNSEEILELISVDQTLRVCFDTNHLLKESSTDFIKAVGKYIVTTHVSDYDFVDEKHFLPGEGKIDWQKLIDDLNSVGYLGIWMYELGFVSKKIERERPLTPEDFMKNANELFEGKEPTLLKRKYLC